MQRDTLCNTAPTQRRDLAVRCLSDIPLTVQATRTGENLTENKRFKKSSQMFYFRHKTLRTFIRNFVVWNQLAKPNTRISANILMPEHTEADLKALWNTTPCRPVNSCWCFGADRCLHLHGIRRQKRTHLFPFLLNSTHPEDGGNYLLRNISNLLPVHMAS